VNRTKSFISVKRNMNLEILLVKLGRGETCYFSSVFVCNSQAESELKVMELYQLCTLSARSFVSLKY